MEYFNSENRHIAASKSDNFDQSLLAAAAIGSAALLLATKGKSGAGMVHAMEESGVLPRLSAKFIATVEKQGATVMHSDSHLASVANSAQSGASEISPALSSSLKTYTRSAEQEDRFAESDRLRNAAYDAASRDSEVVSQVQAKREAIKASGEVIPHPVTGLPLSEVEVRNALYMKALPRKSALEFAEDGNLMPGLYRLSFADFKAQFGMGSRREMLLGNFEEVLQGLKAGGVKEVHVGGSFVTKKAAPHDIDFIWNKHESVYNRTAVANYDHGVLLSHDDRYLKSKGLQMMVNPPTDGTYSGMQHFFAHKRAEWPAYSRGNWRTTGTNIPTGLVELDLTSLPRKWVVEATKLAA